jgi:hypothetical protein
VGHKGAPKQSCSKALISIARNISKRKRDGELENVKDLKKTLLTMMVHFIMEMDGALCRVINTFYL